MILKHSVPSLKSGGQEELLLKTVEKVCECSWRGVLSMAAWAWLAGPQALQRVSLAAGTLNQHVCYPLKHVPNLWWLASTVAVRIEVLGVAKAVSSDRGLS